MLLLLLLGFPLRLMVMVFGGLVCWRLDSFVIVIGRAFQDTHIDLAIKGVEVSYTNMFQLCQGLVSNVQNLYYRGCQRVFF